MCGIIGTSEIVFFRFSTKKVYYKKVYYNNTRKTLRHQKPVYSAATLLKTVPTFAFFCENCKFFQSSFLIGHFLMVHALKILTGKVHFKIRLKHFWKYGHMSVNMDIWVVGKLTFMSHNMYGLIYIAIVLRI